MPELGMSVPVVRQPRGPGSSGDRGFPAARKSSTPFVGEVSGSVAKEEPKHTKSERQKQNKQNQQAKSNQQDGLQLAHNFNAKERTEDDMRAENKEKVFADMLLSEPIRNNAPQWEWEISSDDLYGVDIYDQDTPEFLPKGSTTIKKNKEMMVENQIFKSETVATINQLILEAVGLTLRRATEETIHWSSEDVLQLLMMEEPFRRYPEFNVKIRVDQLLSDLNTKVTERQGEQKEYRGSPRPGEGKYSPEIESLISSMEIHNIVIAELEEALNGQTYDGRDLRISMDAGRPRYSGDYGGSRGGGGGGGGGSYRGRSRSRSRSRGRRDRSRSRSRGRDRSRDRGSNRGRDRSGDRGRDRSAYRGKSGSRSRSLSR